MTPQGHLRVASRLRPAAGVALLLCMHDPGTLGGGRELGKCRGHDQFGAPPPAHWTAAAPQGPQSQGPRGTECSQCFRVDFRGRGDTQAWGRLAQCVIGNVIVRQDYGNQCNMLNQCNRSTSALMVEPSVMFRLLCVPQAYGYGSIM